MISLPYEIPRFALLYGSWVRCRRHLVGLFLTSYSLIWAEENSRCMPVSVEGSIGISSGQGVIFVMTSLGHPWGRLRCRTIARLHVDPRRQSSSASTTVFVGCCRLMAVTRRQKKDSKSEMLPCCKGASKIMPVCQASRGSGSAEHGRGSRQNGLVISSMHCI